MLVVKDGSVFISKSSRYTAGKDKIMDTLVWGIIGALLGWLFILLMYVTRTRLVIGSFAFGVAGAVLGGYLAMSVVEMKSIGGIPPIGSVFAAIAGGVVFLFIYRLLLRGVIRW